MNKPILRKRLLFTYSSIFPDRPVENIDTYIKDVPTLSALEFLAYINLNSLLRKENESEPDLFFSIFFNLEYEFIIRFTDFYNQNNNLDFQFWNHECLLKLTQLLLTNNNGKSSTLTKKDYTNIMLTYFLCCAEAVKLSCRDFDTITDSLSFASIYLPEQLSCIDVDYPRDYKTEFIKFSSFMKFCELDEEFKEFQKIFLDTYNLKRWNDYLNMILHIYLDIVENKTPVVIFEGCTDYLYNFLYSISLNITDKQYSADFKRLKNTPILCIDKEKKLFLILDIKFFIDKMFFGFLFDFANILFRKGKISGFPELKKKIGERFSERYLFYETIQSSFNGKLSCFLSGKELRTVLKRGEPDLYIRNNSRIFLFEFKDILLNSDVKHSYDFDLIYEELMQLFYLSTHERLTNKPKKKPQPKGITQLANVIYEKLPLIWENMDHFHQKAISVYPIIIYMDYSFDSDGINFLLNRKFKDLLEVRGKLNYKIKDLILINLNTLIQLEDYFKTGKLKLETCLHEYISYISTEKYMVTSFNKFIIRKAQSKGYFCFKITNRFRLLIKDFTN